MSVVREANNPEVVIVVCKDSVAINPHYDQIMTTRVLNRAL